MSSDKNEIRDQSDIRKYFTIIPNVVIKGELGSDLSPLAKLLYIYFKSVAGENGKCFQTIRTIADNLGISKSSVSKFKKELADIGLISIEKQAGKPGSYNSDIITINDIWQQNIAAFKGNKPVRDTDNPVRENDRPVHILDGPVRVSVHNKNPINKNPTKKRERARVRVDSDLVPEALTSVPGFQEKFEFYCQYLTEQFEIKVTDPVIERKLDRLLELKKDGEDVLAVIDQTISGINKAFFPVRYFGNERAKEQWNRQMSR